MRLIDADELLEHAGRDRLDSRELIFEMINNAPTITLPIKMVWRYRLWVKQKGHPADVYFDGADIENAITCFKVYQNKYADREDILSITLEASAKQEVKK